MIPRRSILSAVFNNDDDGNDDDEYRDYRVYSVDLGFSLSPLILCTFISALVFYSYSLVSDRVLSQS